MLPKISSGDDCVLCRRWNDSNIQWLLLSHLKGDVVTQHVYFLLQNIFYQNSDECCLFLSVCFVFTCQICLYVLNYTSQTRSCKEAVILQVGSLEEFVIAASVWMILPVGQSSWFQV